MFRHLGHLLLFAWASVAVGADDVKPRVDLHGDPLPPGAVARLGTTRLHAVNWLRNFTFSPDGRHLYTAGSGAVNVWEVATGKPVKSLKVGEFDHFDVSPDGFKLAVMRRDGSWLRTHSTWDGKKLRDLETTKSRYVRWSGDGKTLVAWEEEGVRLFDSATGKERRNIPFGRWSYQHQAVSFDGRVLARSGGNWIETWDGRTSTKLASWVGQAETIYALALSPDGKSLVSGSLEGVARIWDPATGKKLAEFRAKSTCLGLEFAADGKTLLVADGKDFVHTLDCATWKKLSEVRSPHEIWGFARSPDGKTVASSTSEAGVLSVWDLSTGKPRFDYACHVNSPVAAITPDGGMVASVDGSSWHIHLWDASTGKLQRRVKGSDADCLSWAAPTVAFLPDGKRVHSSICSGSMRRPDRESDALWGFGATSHTVWNIATGEELGSFNVADPSKNGWSSITSTGLSADGKTVSTVFHDEGKKRFAFFQHELSSGNKLFGRHGFSEPAVFGVFSPDGQTFAPCDGRQYRNGNARPEPPNLVEDFRTGKTLHRLGADESFTPGRFSPDGQWLIGECNGYRRVACYRLATGKVVFHIDLPGWPGEMAWSADGRLIAIASGHDEITIWEAATAKNIARLKGPDGISSLAMTPNGGRLVSGCSDGSLLVWDLAEALKHVPAAKLDAAKMQSLWDDLQEMDAAPAYAAILSLVAAPDCAVPFLNDRLAPITPFEAERLRELIGQLESSRFAVRKAAAAELANAPERLDESQLRSVRKNLASLDGERWMKAVFEQSPLLLSGERLCQYRSIQALENIGSPEARAILKKLAQGLPAARQTREAKQAFERLAASRSNAHK